MKGKKMGDDRWWVKENPMVVDMFWNKPSTVAWCDRCGVAIHDDEPKHKLSDEVICEDCWNIHVEAVGDDE